MLIAFILFVLGLSWGSFVNALVWRLHEQTKSKKLNVKSKTPGINLSIVNGRSMCPDCRHLLAWYDLVPLFSWIALKGKCRYCKKPISPQYPTIELIAGIVFAGSYLLWPSVVHLNGQWLLLSTWLAASVGLLALAVYDLRWMILPNRIIYPTLAVAVAGRVGYIAAFENQPLHAVLLWAGSIVISSGVFLALFEFSKGKWIGYGDVRLGLITGSLLADPAKSLAMIFIASLIGTLVIIPSLRAGKRTLASKLPFGPFLIAATGIMVVFGDRLLDWYKNLIF